MSANERQDSDQRRVFVHSILTDRTGAHLVRRGSRPVALVMRDFERLNNQTFLDATMKDLWGCRPPGGATGKFMAIAEVGLGGEKVLDLIKGGVEGMAACAEHSRVGIDVDDHVTSTELFAKARAGRRLLQRHAGLGELTAGGIFT